MVKEFLSHREIDYLERDVAQSEEAFAELEQLGYFTTPVTVIGDDIVIGFDKKRLEALFG